MEQNIFSSEAWSLFGIALTSGGALIGAIVAAWVQRGKNRADASMALVDNLQEEVKRLRTEVDQLRENESKAHEAILKVQSEAFAMMDFARLQISISSGYIYQLRAHIETEQGPPAPPIPTDLAELMAGNKPM